MGFLNEASKLLTNKKFLYFMVFLAATNILSYLVTNKINAVIFFALVSLITYQFSKNMSVVLIIAIITTNFLMVNKKMREGLENETTEDSQSLSKIEDKDPEIANAITAVKESGSEEEVKAKISEQKNASNTNTNANTTKIVDTNNTDLNTSTETGPEGFGESIGGKKNSTKSEHFGPRLDYAATIEQSYQNLDNILGSDSIKQLTNDTQKLMKQQQHLFDTMQNMVPVLQGAQNLLKDFNIGGLTDSLKNIGGLTNAPTIAPKKK
jgi:predicted ATP-dependent protease